MDSVYHGFNQCELPSAIYNLFSDAEAVSIFPNPTRNHFEVLLSSNIKAEDVKSVSVWGVNGQSVFSVNGYQQNIHTGSLPAGAYYVVVKTDKKNIVKKLLLQ